jgi:photosystem II stability/assembly factor-like uncharacterized protein
MLNRPLVILVLAFLPASALASDHRFTWLNPRPQGNSIEGFSFEDPQNGYAVGLGGAVLATRDGGQSWEARSLFDRFAKDLHDVAALGAGELIAVGARPGVFRSLDGGRSFVGLLNPSTATLRDVDVIAPDVLSAIDDEGQVLRSTDRGLTWVLRPIPSPATLLEQFWRDPDHGYVVGINAAFQTSNGGASWSKVPGVDQDFDTFGDVFFTDATHGAIAGSFGFWRTQNGGATWSFVANHGGPVYQGR